MKPIEYRAKCEGMTQEGKGLFKYRGKLIEVSNFLTGEEAELLIFKQKFGFSARVKEIIKAAPDRVPAPCPYYEQCGGCQLQHMSIDAQNKFKQKAVTKQLKPYGKAMPIITMEDPYEYRNKSHYSFGLDYKKQVISGIYAEYSHKIISIEHCLIQNPKADNIVLTIKELMKSFKMKAYVEDEGHGFLRHILIKTGRVSGQIMVVLVVADKLFPSKANFVSALLERHPEITTIVMNVNNQKTSMILGSHETVLYGKGFIEDTLSGLHFEISPKSFYQINPVQTEKLYQKAIQMAGLTGDEVVIDTYCGIGTIGLIASKHAKEVIGVELNKQAVRNAIDNAKKNNVKNIKFYQADAGDFMVEMADQGKHADVVIMDPPRSGSDKKFIDSLAELGPKTIVYVSCNPVTQARDLGQLSHKGYKVEKIQPVDMFPQTYHVETVVLLKKDPNAKVVPTKVVEPKTEEPRKATAKRATSNKSKSFKSNASKKSSPKKFKRKDK